MATIAELVAQHSKVPGDIRVFTLFSSELEGKPFRPYFSYLASGLSTRWHGTTRNGSPLVVTDRDYFELYVEPKPSLDDLTDAFCYAVKSHFSSDRTVKVQEPKVMRAQYVLWANGINRPFTPQYWYKDDADLRKEYNEEAYQIAIRLEERDFEK